MELVTISQLSKLYGISTRTLRYYEEIGLIESNKQEGYAYRMYDEGTMIRLQQILILRKLRIKLNEIAKIINNDTVGNILEVLCANLKGVNEEIHALTTIKMVLEQLISYLHINNHIPYDLFEQDDLIKSIQDLPLSKTKLKEESVKMENLHKADYAIKKLKEDDVRIIYLPPCVVASAEYIGESPEDIAGKMLNNFVRAHELIKIKPDLRVFGFNNPCPTKVGEPYGYEVWVTIPEEMNVPMPLKKKYFEGGLYASHCIKMGNFEEWKLITEWVESSNEYIYEKREPFGMNGSLEEHLNTYMYYTEEKELAQFRQLDLLIPIKKI